MEKTLKKNNSDKIAITIFIIVAVIGLLILIFFYWIYDINKTAPIGNAIAGIFGTSISIGAALLVYYSFIEQVRANRELSKQLDDNRLLELYKLFKPTEEIISIKQNFVFFTNQFNAFKQKKKINWKLYEDYEFMEQNVQDNINIYEDLVTIYNTAKKLLPVNTQFQNNQFEFQNIYISRMYNIIVPYLFYLNINNKEDEVYKLTGDFFIEGTKKLIIPLIKIAFANNQISNDSLLNIEKKGEDSFTISKVLLNSLNDIRSYNFDLNITEENYKQRIVADNIFINQIPSDNYYLSWEIKFNNSTYTYIDEDEYLINIVKTVNLEQNK